MKNYPVCKELKNSSYQIDLDYINCEYIRPALKKSWFAVLLPTHPKQPLPKNVIAFLKSFFFLLFCSQTSLKSLKAVF